jgi:hypothetical protein
MFLAALSLPAFAGDKDVLPGAPVANALPTPSAAIASNLASNALPSAPVAAAPLPATPAISPAVMVKPEPKHQFFDAKNSLGLALLGAGLTGDALSTQKGLGRPGFHEMNPIARPFVQSRAGAALYSAGSFALMGSGMYLTHKTGHHKLERILPFALAGWETALTIRNYHLISSSTKTH